MKLSLVPFQNFINRNTTEKTRSRYNDSEILEISIGDDEIRAKIYDSTFYHVKIEYNKKDVSSVYCSCPYDGDGVCKHIVHVLVHTDNYFHAKKYEDTLFPQTSKAEKSIKPLKEEILHYTKNTYNYTIPNQQVLYLSFILFETICLKKKVDFNIDYDMQIQKNKITTQIKDKYSWGYSGKAYIEQKGNNIELFCDCSNSTNKLCEHLKALFRVIQQDNYLSVAFDEQKWYQNLNEIAEKKGLKNLSNEDLDETYSIRYKYGRMFAESNKNIISLSSRNKSSLKTKLFSKFEFPKKQHDKYKEFLVISINNYSKNFEIKLMHSSLSMKGEIKSPIVETDLYKKAFETQNPAEIQFFTTLLSLKKYPDLPIYQQAVLKNPLQFPIYLQSNDYYKVTPKNIQLLQFLQEPFETEISVKEKGNFYHLKAAVIIDNKKIAVSQISLMGVLLQHKENIAFVKEESVAKILQFFINEKNDIFIHKSQFTEFKTTYLDVLENSVKVNYAFVKKAPKQKVVSKSWNKITERIIYLAEEEDYILITPVVVYGEKEIPLLSRRTLYVNSPDGNMLSVDRDEKEELQFLRSVQSQHSTFADYPQTEFFYLHKQEFLEEGWFLDVFEEWRNQKITILGFNKIKNNLYSAYKMKTVVSVNSGINWFDINIDVSYGNQKVKLKDIQKSILNKKRFVKLGDGTHGLMPEEWIEKFGHYFRTGEIKNNTIKTHKSNFQLIDDLFQEEVLSKEVQLELAKYKEKIKHFKTIDNIKVPKKLKATLRDYQKEGLNWLHFLDEFGFGGCLADDMGLGKTVQIIAYFLSQHEKGNTATHLVIVPTSLLFNWQKELDKFAPHLKYKALYGSNRDIKNVKFDQWDIILTTYGTLLTDIGILKKEIFNIIVLDESQAIKNPASKRYKAVRLLQGRQKIVLTGTPVENNTFDLYAQLSFAIPGLLGNIQHFKDNYSTPIDKFQDQKRAQELQRKVHPFILRRTKKQVAKELPEKTEMVIYCEMGKEQRKVYDTYKAEFQSFLQGTSDEEFKNQSLHILQGLTKLRQICNSPALLSDNEYYGDESAKLEELMIQILNLKGEHKILVFSQFVGMLELIKEKLNREKIKYAYLTGKTRKREEQVELFQNDEEIRVFLISLKAGGMGLNLTQAEYVFIVDPWWNPSVENQAIDRAYRIGQKNNITATRLIVLDSIEEKIMELQERKLELIENLIHTDTNVFKSLSKKDLLQLV